MAETSLTAAAGITSTTNGNYVAVQPIGDTLPVPVEIFGKALGTSGAFSVTFVVQTSADASSFSTHSTHTIAGTATSKPFAFQSVVKAPFIRINVTSISGTGAALVARARFA